MPFWHGDGPGRPLEFGHRIGAMVRELRGMERNAAVSRLTREHDLDPQAADNLLRFLVDQEIATTEVPDDRTIVIERCRDELGDWRVCVLTPFGSRIHAPWAMAVSGELRRRRARDIETMWTDDGFVLRFPETDEPPDIEVLMPDPAKRRLGDAAVGIDCAVCGEVPRERGAGSVIATATRARTRSAVAAAQARVRSAGGGFAIRVVSDAAGGLSRMFARRLRHAGVAGVLAGLQSRNIRVHMVESRTPRRSRLRCCLGMWPILSTKAMLRWRSGGRRRLPSIRISCAILWATRTCASCWMQRRLKRLRSSCRPWMKIIAPRAWMACMICCYG